MGKGGGWMVAILAICNFSLRSKIQVIINPLQGNTISKSVYRYCKTWSYLTIFSIYLKKNSLFYGIYVDILSNIDMTNVSKSNIIDINDKYQISTQGFLI